MYRLIIENNGFFLRVDYFSEVLIGKIIIVELFTQLLEELYYIIDTLSIFYPLFELNYIQKTIFFSFARASKYTFYY